jgi:hypothetical protein
MLDSLSELFFNPWVFWGTPLALALMWSGLRRAWNWLRHRV